MSLKGSLSRYFDRSHRHDDPQDHTLSVQETAKKHMEKEVVTINDDDVDVVLENEEAIKKKFSGTTSVSKYAELGQIMIGMLKDIKNGIYKEVPWFTIATVVLALLYLLNPFDIIPDFVPGIGYIDDLSVLAIATGWVESEIGRAHV